MHHHAKFLKIGIRCGDVAILQLFKLAAIRHLGFV